MDRLPAAERLPVQAIVETQIIRTTNCKEGNWIPTKKGQRFFMLFRFYGATPAAYDGSFELNDIEKLN